VTFRAVFLGWALPMSSAACALPSSAQPPPPLSIAPITPVAPPPIAASSAVLPCPAVPADAVSKPRPPASIRWPGAACVARGDQLLARMTLREKIGQMVQPDARRVTSRADVARFGFGSILCGGDSDPPAGNSARDWALWVADFHGASLESRLHVPVLFGIDGVHGHNNVVGAVLFPHQVGLGATRDPALVERVARVAALELAATGIDWTFAPVMAAARDERWGRTYEAFGETAELAESLGAAAIRGFQNAPPGEPRVLACAKHFAGDGGTLGGRDRGDTVVDDGTLDALHLRQYRAAVAAGVGSIMVSYSSVRALKMHCNHHLLTEVLKHEMGFDGFLVSDWEAIDQLPGSYPEEVASAVDAGVDMIMAPKSYETLVETLAGLVPSRVPEARIDDAARRILSVKCEMGGLDGARFQRDAAGAVAVDEKLLCAVGSPAHRDVAREAVRRSLVLLKNDRGALPLARSAPRIHLAGLGADDLGRQCGGWTVSWQGGSGPVTTGTTLREAITTLASPKTRVTYSKDGSGAEGASAVVVVGGEAPYAEWKGDRADLTLDAEDLAALQAAKKSGAPVVLVLLTGRPLILGPALDLADAILVAWLPGTEGLGVADVLFGDAPPTGKLGHSWPRRMIDVPLNVGDPVYDPLFPYGFGLTYAAAPPHPAR
jgi:beta-glucosidase